MTTRGIVLSWSPRRTGTPALNPLADIAFDRILRLASAIENDPFRVDEWYRSVCIREFGGMTAKDLVKQGKAGLVVKFLLSIRHGERD
jgi:hypothetical protein